MVDSIRDLLAEESRRADVPLRFVVSFRGGEAFTCRIAH